MEEVERVPHYLEGSHTCHLEERKASMQEHQK